MVFSMTRTHLPPQAYTSDTLAKAYEWLRGQSPAIQEMAKSADALVALYLQAKRRPGFLTEQSNPEEAAPLSSLNFKEDLKSIAIGLKKFEGNGAHTPAPEPPKEAPLSAMKSALQDVTLQKMLGEVRAAFNMQSDLEVIRMLVSLGFERVKELFPKPK